MEHQASALSPAALREAVGEAYTAVAAAPDGRHPFPVGRDFAERAGFPDALLDGLPVRSVEAFAGVSNVSLTAPIEPGMSVLDLGCGAGLDALVAAQRVGPSGRVVAVDFSPEMVARTRAAAEALGLTQLEARCAPGENLDLEDASFDVALVNGLFNLNPFRAEVMSELARVLRPGGKLRIAELVLVRPVAARATASLKDWFS